MKVDVINKDVAAENTAKNVQIYALILSDSEETFDEVPAIRNLNIEIEDPENVDDFEDASEISTVIDEEEEQRRRQKIKPN